MQTERRERLLKILVGVGVGLLLLDWIVLTPAAKRWKTQGERIASLKEKVTRGQRLLQNEKAIRARWEAMQRSDLAPDMSEAEEQVYSAIQKWAAGTGISTNSLSPQWRTQDEDFDLYEFRASTAGTQAALGRFIYNLETDGLPVKLEECDLTSRDPKGQQLSGGMRFSFIRLKTSNAKP
jgi:hypothetical protein